MGIDHAGIGAVGDHRLDGVRVEVHFPVELRAGVGGQLPPRRERALPVGPLRRAGTAAEIGVGRLIRRDHAGARSSLDGHVADGHALVHVERANGLAAILDDVARAARDADLADDGENQVLRRDARGQPSAHVDGERARLALQQALGRENVADLRRADAERERAERAMRARVTVPADDGLARLRDPELRADDVNDAALRMPQAEQLDAELAAVRFELPDLPRRGLDRDRRPAEDLLRASRRGMIHGAEGEVPAPHRKAPAHAAPRRPGARSPRG